MNGFHQLTLLVYIILWNYNTVALSLTTPITVNESTVDSNTSVVDSRHHNGPPGRPPPNGHSSGGGASATATAIVYCFSGDSLVTLANRKHILVGDLQPGDTLLTIDGIKLIPTEMIMMLDKHASMMSMFYTITTMSGHNISLTSSHLIPIIRNNSQLTYIPAKDIKYGDILYVFLHGNLVQSAVVRTKLETKRGYFAPLSMAGTLFVNDILVSCYAYVQNHDAAHFYMAPLRWYYQLARSVNIKEPFGTPVGGRIHFIPQMMYNFARQFRPSTLSST